MSGDPSTSRTGRGISPYIPVGAEIGPYRVEAYLDRGGMASVYEATDLRYIANHESNVLSVLNVASNTVVNKIPVGTSPHSVAVSPDGKQVAVVCFDSNDLYFIDTATNKVQGRVPVGTNPQDVSYAADGRYLYTADVQSNTVTVVDTDTETRTKTASIPTDSPTSVAVLPNGRKAYVTNLYTGTLTVLNTAQ